MTYPGFAITRRGLLARLGGAGLSCAGLGIGSPAYAATPARQAVTLLAKPALAALRPGAPETRISSLQPIESGPMRFQRGDELAVRFENKLAQPAILNWHGIEGALAAEPLTARRPVAPGGQDEFAIALRHAGTLMLDLRLLTDDAPMPAQALIVQESEAVAVDRDEVVLIEDWRLGPDGRALPPGTETADAEPSYTVNGQPGLDLGVRTNVRLRLRFINGCQRNVIAVKIAEHEVRVMALDGQPSEPFLARDGTLVLAPGTRIDAFVDATKAAGTSFPISLHDGKRAYLIVRLLYSGDSPLREAPLPILASLPDNGLPARIDLKSALRVDLALGIAQDWSLPNGFVPSAAPAFQVKRGRAVVLALTNRAANPVVFHLHGHHFRLLDRLDDGWKPFWLDTLAIDAGQTQRIAFVAEFAGLWLIEAMAANWSAPRLLRNYAVL
ncbi:MAG: multicopper oxidase domain-containing protein [Rhodopseudomonas sp.]|uniref:multicopper oxidase family protein n=1 Tax=Rhodopseudomonas sp. TaxID=1078 RepID=UPI001827C9D4|nr:multicopper oxidase domain-containing protein [Rhodopseudomonas sp.]NVN86303.1 multicopper oxidase domain-containing protein [Rhodopseudomonas sp.]